jgi:hypothetical protein
MTERRFQAAVAMPGWGRHGPSYVRDEPRDIPGTVARPPGFAHVAAQPCAEQTSGLGAWAGLVVGQEHGGGDARPGALKSKGVAMHELRDASRSEPSPRRGHLRNPRRTADDQPKGKDEDAAVMWTTPAAARPHPVCTLPYQCQTAAGART